MAMLVDREGMNSDQVDDSEEKNLWTKILSQVQSSSVNKLPTDKNILVLGDCESGKTTLVAKLQGNEDPKKGTGLEYFYLNVRDDYRDDHTRLGAWILDGDAYHKNLLKFALSEKSFPHTLVILVAPMNQPWVIMESLENWAALLEEHIGRLKLSPDEFRDYQLKRVKSFQSYVDPGDELDNGGSSPHKRTSASFPNSGTNLGSITAASPTDVDDSLLLPLGETTLTHNLGIEIIVAITKTDHMSILKQEQDYKDEHFDFIQQRIRKFCLNYGAALFYTSVKEDKNCDVLYRYLVHRIYGLPFSSPALVVEEDAVFIPSGWDNEKKISILYENLSKMKPDDNYSDVIVRPIVRKIQRETELQAENDQMFLMRQQAIYNQQAPTSKKQETIMRSPAGVQKPSDRRMSSPGQTSLTPQKMDGAKNMPTNEGVLANFFNSLLNKKTGAGHPAPSMKGADKAVRNDAAAELDRMTSPKKAVLNTISNSEKSRDSSS